MERKVIKLGLNSRFRRTIAAPAYLGCSRPGARPNSPRQHGVALIISLLFLLVIVLLGVASIRTTTLEERMAGNAGDYNIAFQAAESALRDAEEFIETQPDLQLFDNTGGLLSIDQNEPTQVFSAVHWTAANSKAYSDTIEYVATTPRYRIKIRLANEPESNTLNINGYGQSSPGPTSAIFRITARGTGATNNSQLVLQSHYGKTFD